MDKNVKIAQRKVKQYRDNLQSFGREIITLANKDAQVVSFNLNKAQEYIDKRISEQRKRTGKVRAIILKGRQQGASKYNCLRSIRNTMFYPNKKAFVMAHDSATTSSLFGDLKSMYNSCPPVQYIKPKLNKNNARILEFGELGSSVTVGTAGSEEVARGLTIHDLWGCLSKDSLIILKDGTTKSMGDIKIGDEVLTSSGDFAPVKNKIYTGKKQTYTLETWSTGEPIHATEDHKILTQDGYKKVKDLSLSDSVAVPKNIGKNHIKDYSYKLKNKSRPQGGGSRHVEEYTFKLDNGFGYFIGNYLADGHIKKGEGNISICVHKNEAHFTDKAISGLGDYKVNYKRKNVDNKTITYIYDKFLASAVKGMCGRVENKHVPSWFFNCSDDFLEGVFRGYLDGDGSKNRNNKIIAVSIHEKIARQMQRICCRLYGACSVKKHTNRFRYEKRTKDIYKLSMSGNTHRKYKKQESMSNRCKSFITNENIYCNIKSITPRKIEDVWDIEVDHKDHNYQTTAGIVSNSEVAFWNNGDKILAALFQTVPPSKGTEIKLESTANGMGNTFYRMCMQALKGIGEYELIFVPWWWTEEYQTELDEDFALSEEECDYFKRMEKTFCGSLEDAMTYLNWRRNKIVEIGEKKFKQEYPADPHEAFQQSGECLFDVDAVNAAMESKVKEDERVPLVMGVDAAERGDRTAICMRRGKEVIRLLTWDEMDEMRLAGIVGRLINQERPTKVFFDKAYANGCVSRLKELGYGNIVKAIPFSMQAIDKDIYVNKRAEMHYLAKDWLDQGYLDKDEDGLSAVSIPNSVAFQTDLLAIPECDPTSSGKLKIIDKAKIKEELGMSPDLCDAFILTFAEPVMYYRHNGNKLNIKTKTITQKLMEGK